MKSWVVEGEAEILWRTLSGSSEAATDFDWLLPFPTCLSTRLSAKEFFALQQTGGDRFESLSASQGEIVSGPVAVETLN